MTALGVVLSVFSIVNVAFWALLAWAWAVQPAWAARIPLGLGTDQRYRAAVPVWARLAAAVAGFWAVAAVMYLTVHQSDRLAFTALFVLAAVFLILAIGAAARVYHVLQLPDQATFPKAQKKAS